MFLSEHDFPSTRRSAARTTPWWAWFVGGAAAVGVGAAAAIWFAARAAPDLTPHRPPARAAAETASAPPAAPATANPAAETSAPPATTIAPASATTSATAAPAPAVAPDTPPPTEPPRPALVEVRFDSSPSGSVFSDGRTAELCQTPCSFDIDLGDGGPVAHRTFIVRRAGYRDYQVVVDLTGARREFAVVLQRDATTPVRADATDRRPGKRSRPARKDARDGKASRDSKDATDGSARDARDAHDDTARPVEPQRPADKKATGTAIDPSDTLDPFRKK
jgi:hypothetical protein